MKTVLSNCVIGLAGLLAAGALQETVGQSPSPAQLPWTQQGVAGKPSARRAQSGRELLVNVDDSQLAKLQDGQPLSVDEDEVLYRILYRLPMFGAYDTERLSVPLDGAVVEAEPAASRVRLFHLQGRVVGVERVEVLRESARRLGFDFYWKVRFQLADPERTAILCARWVPEAWRGVETLDERAAAYAVFLKTGEPTDNHTPLYFACDRLQWFPQHAVPNQIAKDHVLLANLGFDFSRLADLDGRAARPLGRGDLECFYQMLRAAGRASPEQLAAAAPFDLAPFLLKPAERHGELFRVAGRLKRITPVEVGDDELQERFGIDRYYQLDIVVGLGDQEVRLAKGPDDKEAPIITGAFPIVVCVYKLPEAFGELAKERDLNEDIEFDGFYFRLWSFQSGLLNKFALEKGTDEAGAVDATKVESARRRQPSPLFIAHTARLVVRDDSQQALFGMVLGGLIVLIIVALLAAQWYVGAADRRAKLRLREILDAQRQ